MDTLETYTEWEARRATTRLIAKEKAEEAKKRSSAFEIRDMAWNDLKRVLMPYDPPTLLSSNIIQFFEGV